MTSNFELLLGDLTPDAFFSTIYGREPVLLRGHPGKFGQIFGLEDFNRVLNFTALEYPRVRVTDHGNTIHKYDLIDDRDRYANNINNELNRRKVLMAIARGGTLVFDRIQEFHPALEAFIDGLTQQLDTHVSTNGYYTARRQRGVNVHFDRHDVFAIQVHGSKRWFYREDQHVLSRAIRHQAAPAVPEDFAGWKSVLLREGDVFYCPRGVWHFTQTEDEHSAHLALGLYPLTLGDWLRGLESDPDIADLLETFVSHPASAGGGLADMAPLEQLVKAMRDRARQPVASGVRAPRPYLELE